MSVRTSAPGNPSNSDLPAIAAYCLVSMFVLITAGYQNPALAVPLAGFLGMVFLTAAFAKRLHRDLAGVPAGVAVSPRRTSLTK